MLYCITDGKEIAFAVYIPVDFVLFIGMAAFYFMQWKVSIEKKEDEEKRKKLIMDKTKTGIASLLYSKKSEIRSLEVDKEIEHAATVLGSGRVIKD